VRIWGRVGIRRDGKIVRVDRAGHPNLANFLLTDTVKPAFDASEPSQQFLGDFIHSMEHVGGYSEADARATLESHAITAGYAELRPNQSRQLSQRPVFTDHIIAHRLNMLSTGKIPPDGRTPHTDTLTTFPYLGTPHEQPDAAPAQGVRCQVSAATSVRYFEIPTLRRCVGRSI
jgi:hypothetical protein